MASEVDIANLALAHLGDDATISSFDPPEGSPQAVHCARFYPIARDALLEMHSWNFSTKRTIPALISSEITEWKYSYALPSDALKVFAVLPKDSTDDYSTNFVYDYQNIHTNINMSARVQYTPRPFCVETLPDGSIVVYTNEPSPTIRYAARITDTTKFSPLFVSALSRLLASHIAGPLLKGEVGRAEAKGQYQIFQLELSKALASDSNQRKIDVKHSVPWMAGR